MTPSILHVIQQHGLGGAARSLVAMAAYAGRHLGSSHRVVSLTEPHPRAVDDARRAGIDVLAAPSASDLDRAIDAADIVQVHYWNSPELMTFLQTTRPMRTVLWCDVAGNTAPHVLTPALAEWPDALVASCAYTAALPAFATQPSSSSRRHLVLGTAGFDRVADVQPIAHDGFVVGYVGTVDFAKMDRRFVAMHAALEIPGLTCVVHGSGGGFPALEAEAGRLGVARRFEFAGYAHDLARALARFDVFGYPLAEGTFAAAEIVLQEAMYAGVPPVIFRRGGAACMVEHGRTGMIVDTEAEYVSAVEYLYAHPEKRQAMGRAATDAARQMFDLGRATRKLRAIYDAMLQRPPRRHTWPRAAATGARLFVDTLGDLRPEYRVSLTSQDDEAVFAAERIIRSAPETVRTAAAGGVLHYRRYFPNDPVLRLWAGLVLLGGSRPALAAAELRAAASLGLAHWRVSWYLAQAALAAGADDLADEALAAVVQAAPTFAPARAALSRRNGTPP